MKLKCNDGVVRRFTTAQPATTMTFYGPAKIGYMGEARCEECEEAFGVHDTHVLKSRFKAHVCKKHDQ